MNKGYWTLAGTLAGALAGALARGWKGAALGAGAGFGLATLLERARENQEGMEPEAQWVGAGYPEEGILDAMREAQGGPSEGAEMENFYQDVVGSHPAGLAAAEEKAGSPEEPPGK